MTYLRDFAESFWILFGAFVQAISAAIVFTGAIVAIVRIVRRE